MSNNTFLAEPDLQGLSERFFPDPRRLFPRVPVDLGLRINSTTVTTLTVRVGMIPDLDAMLKPWATPPRHTFKVLGWRVYFPDDSTECLNEVQRLPVTLSLDHLVEDVPFTFNQPPSPGKYAFFCWVDCDQEVAEINEGNNTARFPSGADYLHWPSLAG